MNHLGQEKCAAKLSNEDTARLGCLLKKCLGLGLGLAGML